MNKFITILSIYIIGCLIGIIIELIYTKGRHRCIENFKFNCITAIVIGNFYGWGLVFIYLLRKQLNKLNIIVQFILLFIGISIFEGIGGMISYTIYGKQNWKYTSGIPFFNGYVSILTSTLFTIYLLISKMIMNYVFND